ncbi:MAG: DNA-directed RNA polymerase subunit omega [Terriglobia bacterium]|jgi:DNA-directed RNA polymerase subunit omega
MRERGGEGGPGSSNLPIPPAAGPFDFAIWFWLIPIDDSRTMREIKMELPQGVDSKFRYILVAAKRAHQLIGGAKARVQSESKKVIVIAQRELCAGLVPFILTDVHGNILDKVAQPKVA